MKKTFSLFAKISRGSNSKEDPSLYDDKVKHEKEIAYYKEVYEYAQKELDDLVERKRHIEIKILYLLQAGALVITLFTALLGYIIKSDFIYIKVSSWLVIFFYIIISLSVVCLVISLNDSLASWELTKLLFKKIHRRDINRELNEEYSKDEIIGLHIEAPTSKVLLELDIAKIGKSSFYKKITKSFIRSIATSNILLLCKNMYFNLALRFFIISIILVVTLGILVV